ncbi:MAG: DUF2330 domain-containing protein [Flavobacteriales bacterium]
MKTQLHAWKLAMALTFISNISFAFCGFYVAKADASLFNNKSEVIMVRDGNHNVITMSSDFQGKLSDFAMVVPVPVVLKESDVKIVERNIFQVLNDYSAPRLVDYYDNNPCYNQYYYDSSMMREELDEVSVGATSVQLCSSESVRIEAQFSVDEYDIIILSATESTGLQTWLNAHGYKVPAQASEVLEPYIKSNMKFFLVKVNLDKASRRNDSYLRPIQIRFDHDKFMLPLRLGMANSQGSQDMVVYAFTRTGRVECTNYRTVKMPTDRNLPLYVQPKFGDFYKTIFERNYLQEGRNAVFLEYAWNLSPYVTNHCDPCVGPPPVNEHFVQAGLDWLTAANANPNETIFFTRLHVRYTRDKFPSDLQFQVTPNQELYQCRYIMTHPATGSFDCDEAQSYLLDLHRRRQLEHDELAALTGWDLSEEQAYVSEYDAFMTEKVKKEQEKKNEFWMIDFGQRQLPKLLLLLLIGTVLYLIRKTNKKFIPV